MSSYLQIQARVAQQLAKKGRAVVLRQFTASAGAYNPAVGKPSTRPFIDSTRFAITEDQPGSQVAARFGLTLEKGTLVGNKNKWIYMDARGPQPKTQDRIIFGNVEYSIVSSQECSPGGIPVIYLVVLES
jgi:hypothetical protein